MYYPADDLNDVAVSMPAIAVCPPTEYYFPYTTGGNDLAEGMILTGGTSSCKVRVVKFTVASGTNAGDNMTGIMFVEILSGTITAGENLSIGASVKCVPTTAEIKHGAYGLQAKAMYVSCETQNMRYTLDGTAPTTAMGHLLTAGDELMITGWSNIKRFKWRNAADANNGALHITVMF
jgi:hypothetical protein